MAKTVNLQIDQGETWRWSFQWAAPDPASTAVVPLPPIPYVVLGGIAALQVREKYGSEVLLELSEFTGITLGVDGAVTIEFTDEQTDAMGATAIANRPRLKAKYDLEIEFTDGDRKRVCEGEITLSPNITRTVIL